MSNRIAAIARHLHSQDAEAQDTHIKGNGGISRRLVVAAIDDGKITVSQKGHVLIIKLDRAHKFNGKCLSNWEARRVCCMRNNLTYMVADVQRICVCSFRFYP